MNHEIDDGVRRRWIDGGRRQRRNNHRPGTGVPATAGHDIESAHQPTRDDRSGKTAIARHPTRFNGTQVPPRTRYVPGWLPTPRCPGEPIATYVVLLLVLSQMHLPAGELHADSLKHAYIGPGAGIALSGRSWRYSSPCFPRLWPFSPGPSVGFGERSVIGDAGQGRSRRVVILGLDGLDPQLVEEFLEEGLLPTGCLKESGSYTRMGTTWPPLSPVAWSSFSTGTSPSTIFLTSSRETNPITERPCRRSTLDSPANDCLDG